MNRKILFRGKRVDNGEWVEGFYVVKEDPVYGYLNHFILRQEFVDTLLESTVTWYRIDPNTLGQYTGMTDKNDTKIFEGDIIKFFWNKKYYTDVIEFSPPMFSPSKSCRWSLWKDEVIGNIYDNKELLK